MNKGDAQPGVHVQNTQITQKTAVHEQNADFAFRTARFVSFSLLLCDFDFSMWVFCESQQGKKARPSGPPGGASLLVNRNDVRPRYAGPKDDSILR